MWLSIVLYVPPFITNHPRYETEHSIAALATATGAGSEAGRTTPPHQDTPQFSFDIITAIKHFQECFNGCRGRVTRFPHY